MKTNTKNSKNQAVNESYKRGPKPLVIKLPKAKKKFFTVDEVAGMQNSEISKMTIRNRLEGLLSTGEAAARKRSHPGRGRAQKEYLVLTD